MMTTMKNTLATMLLTGAVAVSGLTACSSSDDSIAEEPTPIVNPTQPQTYHVRIHASMGDGDGTTRAVSFDVTDPVTGNPTSNSTFTSSEKVYVYTNSLLGGYLQPTNISEDGKSCDLTGELTGTLKENDGIVLLYNLSNVNTNEEYINFDYTHQNGTAAGVLDGAIAEAMVKSIDGEGNITFCQMEDETDESARFLNVQSMFRFKFTDGTTPINVKSLSIQSQKNALVTKYSPLSFYGIAYNGITVTLDNATTDYIYVALCIYEWGAPGDVLTFTAIDNDGNAYQGTKAAPNDGFMNGNYYWNSSAITLTKQSALVKPTITWTSVNNNAAVEPNEYNCYDVYGPANTPSAITISGISTGYYFFMYNGSTITLDGLTATYASVNEFIYSQGDLNLIVNGANSITCKNKDQCIFVNGTLKLSGNGTLTVTAKYDGRYGLFATNNYNDSNHGDASVLAAEGYTVTRSDVTNNGNGTYTWTYTVAPQ